MDQPALASAAYLIAVRAQEAKMKTGVFAVLALAWELFASSAAYAQSPVATAPVGATAPSPAGVNSTDSSYKLGPGDKIRVIVFDEPSLSGEFFVSGSGIVSFPLVGDLQVSGVGLDAFRALLQSKLAAGYLRDPRVSVEVLTYRPFYILGEVMKPGEYPYSSGLSVMKAVATAGGFTYRAQTKRVFIRHLADSKEALVTVTSDTLVEPGDTIRVAERFF